MFATGSAARVTLTRVTRAENAATEVGGGVAVLLTDSSTNTTVSITRTALTDCTADDGAGGGVALLATALHWDAGNVTAASAAHLARAAHASVMAAGAAGAVGAAGAAGVAGAATPVHDDDAGGTDSHPRAQSLQLVVEDAAFLR
ncbi:MAG: hypothetical protein ACK41V_23855, partial [Acidovorax sp.]